MNLDAQIAAVAREIAMRKAVYPKWVAQKKMKQEKAGHEIAAMEATLTSLRVLAELVVLKRIKRRIEERTATDPERARYKAEKGETWARADSAVGVEQVMAWPFPREPMP